MLINRKQLINWINMAAWRSFYENFINIGFKAVNVPNGGGNCSIREFWWSDVSNNKTSSISFQSHPM